MKTWQQQMCDVLEIHVPTHEQMDRALFVAACLKVAKEGGSRQDVAKILGISTRTERWWRNKHASELNNLVAECWAENALDGRSDEVKRLEYLVAQL